MKKGDLVWGIVRETSDGWAGSSLHSNTYAPALGLYVDDAVTTSGHQSPILLIGGESSVHTYPIFATEPEAAEYIADKLSSEFSRSKAMISRYGKHRLKTEYYGTVKIDHPVKVKIDCIITEGDAK
jgi:hypothetical protein